jgi:hypothetical protein
MLVHPAGVVSCNETYLDAQLTCSLDHRRHSSLKLTLILNSQNGRGWCQVTPLIAYTSPQLEFGLRSLEDFSARDGILKWSSPARDLVRLWPQSSRRHHLPYGMSWKSGLAGLQRNLAEPCWRLLMASGRSSTCVLMSSYQPAKRVDVE